MQTARRVTLGLAASALALTGPLAGSAAADEPADDESVRSMRIDVRVQEDGSLAVREEVVYDFGSEGHHGLRRFIPVRAAWDQTRDRSYPVADLRVSSPSGAPDQVEQETDDGYLDVRIGDPDSEDVTGEETYVLDYRILAVVDDVPNGGPTIQRFVQDVVGDGWPVPVGDVLVTISAPQALTGITCATGEQGSTGSCDRAEVDAEGDATLAVSDLDPEEGMTVSATMPGGTVTAAPPLLVDTFSPARAFSVDGGTLGASGAVLAVGALGVLAARRRHRADGADTLPGGAPVAVGWQPTPPADAPPGVLGALVHGGATDTDVVATLLDLARRGHLDVEQVPGPDGTPDADWALHRRPDGGQDRTTPAEERLLHTLFREGPDTSLSALRTTALAGVQLTRTALDEDVVRRGWTSTTPTRFATRWFLRAGAVVLTGVVATVLLALFTTYALAGVALVLVGVLALVAAAGLSPLTAAGRVARDGARAFRATLARYGEVDGATGTRFAGYLPHAVALDATDEWASGAQALGAARSPVPPPAWARGYASPGVFNVAVFAGTMGSFSAQTSDALSAAPPAAASSSTVTSTGGGVGGGGGGSW